jgi:hypothetical protein
MLLARFCRCSPVPADPERESEKFDGADAVSDFDQRPRPSNCRQLMHRKTSVDALTRGCLYRPLWATDVHLRRPTATPLDMAHSR